MIYKLMTEVNVLIKAKELISDPAKWTQGFYAKNKDGAKRLPDAEDAVCFCSLGAILKVMGYKCTNSNAPNIEDLPGFSYLETAVQKMAKNQQASIAGFNDENNHTKVMAMWDSAIQLALDEEKAK